MAKCYFESNGFLKVSSQTIEECTGVIALSRDEFLQFSETNLVATLQSLFKFDPVVFSQVCGTGFLMFLVAHGAGNVVRWLGRA